MGAKVIDRLSSDLREATPEMQGLSPRNLKYMRAFAAAWPDRELAHPGVGGAEFVTEFIYETDDPWSVLEKRIHAILQ